MSFLYLFCGETPTKVSAAPIVRRVVIDESYVHHHNYKLEIYAAMQHHSPVSSISSKEIDLARSRSGLFFALQFG